MKPDDKTKIILKKLDEAAKELGVESIHDQTLFAALNFYIIKNRECQNQAQRTSNLVQLKRKIVPFKPRNNR